MRSIRFRRGHSIRPRLWIALAGLNLCALAGSCTRSPSPLEPLLAEAGNLGATGRDLEAARLLHARGESVGPAERGEVSLAAALHFLRAGLPEYALEDAEAAAKAGVKSSELLYVRGESLRRLHRLKEAESALEALLAADPTHALGQLSLGCLKFRSSDPASALPLFDFYFQRAPAADSRRDEAVLEHGRALLAAGRAQDAADRFALLLEKEPLEAPLYAELAAALYRLRHRDEARFVEGIYKLHSQTLRGEEAEKSFTGAGLEGLGLAQHAWNHMKKRRFLSALRAYRSAMDADPSIVLVRLDYADLCRRLRRFRDARLALEEGLRIGVQPSSGLHEALALIHLEEKNPTAALGSAQRAAEALNREGNQGGNAGGQAASSSLLLLVARASVESGDLAQADDVARSGTQVLTGRWEPFYWRGRVELERGRPASALEYLAQAAERAGGDVLDIAYWRVIALEQGGRPDEARATLEKTLETNPGYLPLYAPFLRLESDTSPRKAAIANASTNLERLRKQIEELERAAEAQAIEAAGETYRKLAKLCLRAKDAVASEYLFLAAEILPRDVEILHLLLAGTNQPQDVFVRAHLLRRLIDLETGNGRVAADLASIYRKLHVRLDEAAKITPPSRPPGTAQLPPETR